MIYESNGIYYLKKGSLYQVAIVDIKIIDGIKSLVIKGTGKYVSNLVEPKVYSFEELENKLCKEIN